MTTAPVITVGLKAVILALTPAERLEAMRRFGTNSMSEHWFVVTGVVAVIILTVLLLVVSYNRMVQERKVTNQLFLDYAKRRGLSARERQILLGVASKAGLKQSDAVFTTDDAFDRGAVKVIEESLARHQTTEESKRLKAELSFLREKLGFQRRQSSSIGSPTRPKKLSSRQIPAGKKVHLTRRRTRISDDIEATVIENNDMELRVKFTMPVKIAPGEFWRVHYYFGASVWEFDTSVVGWDGDILVLNHSDSVRFINRRRFLRVPVSKPAFVARFPFARALPPNSDDSKEGPEAKPGSAGPSGRSWGPPEFVPAVITELAGPGLRIEAPLEVKVGDRVLVVLGLEEGERDSTPAATGSGRDVKSTTSKIIEDIGEVRHTKAIQNGLSIAVELTGLSDSDLNELIRATNLASLKAGSESQDIPKSVNTKGGVPKPVAVQGA